MFVVLANERLKAWRLAVGLSQAQAAEKAGLSQAAWCNYERGRSPRLEHAQKLVKVTRGHEHALTLDMFAKRAA